MGKNRPQVIIQNTCCSRGEKKQAEGSTKALPDLGSAGVPVTLERPEGKQEDEAQSHSKARTEVIPKVNQKQTNKKEGKMLALP